MFHENINFKKVLVGLAVGSLAWVVGCASNENFNSSSTTQYFTQSYNPAKLDVLWMIDNRSPMHKMETQLVSETSNFFSRLDALTTQQYKMAIVDADMQFAKGALQPQNSSTQILTKTTGSITDRTNLFASLISQEINLQTGYADQGFDSAYAALTQNFIPEAGVPLVLVFISDSDDHSTNFTGTNAVTYYASAFSALKANDPTMLRVYSVNYASTTDSCATQDYDADINKAGFQNRYFGLANALNGSTADLCGSFSNQIDLTGLQTTTLPSTFQLNATPNASTISVSVFDSTQTYTNLSWTYNAATNSIVFTAPPPQGVTIQVTFSQS
jgi:hypothetical protein